MYNIIIMVRLPLREMISWSTEFGFQVPGFGGVTGWYQSLGLETLGGVNLRL